MGGPPGTKLDDSLQKLADFCAVLAASNANLEKATELMETREAEGAKFDGLADEQLGGLNDELADFARDLPAAEDAAVEELEKAAEAAHAMAEARLGEVRTEIEETEDDLESRLAADGDELEKEMGELSQEGFQATGATLDGVEAEIGRVEDGLEQAFAGLEAALQSAGHEVATARSDAVAAFDAAESALSTDELEALQAEAATAAGGWTEELPGDMESESQAVVTALVAAYQRLEAAVEAEGDELMSGVANLARQAEEELGGSVATELEMAVGSVTTASAAALSTELETLGGSLDQATGTADELAGMAADLARAKVVIADVEAALSGLE